MRPPGFLTALIGHPVIALLIFVSAAAVGYFWLAGDLTGWAAFGALVIAASTAKASDRVNKYNAFKREWDAMGGRAATRRPLRIGGLRYVLGVGAWLFMAMLALDAWDDPGLQWVAWLFWAGSAAMIVAAAYRLVRGPSGLGRGSTDSVRVCLPPARFSPSREDSRRAIPAYCQALFVAR